MSEKNFKSFGEWWFLVGGSIHSLWKNRKYSDIKTLALTLPRNAWEVRQLEIDQLKAQIEELRKIIIEYEREAARERIRKRRGYAPMVRRN